LRLYDKRKRFQPNRKPPRSDGKDGMKGSKPGTYAFWMGICLALPLVAKAMDTAASDNVRVRQVADPHRSAATQLVAATIFHGVGFVTAVAPTGSLTINHEAIDGLMPAMEMMFSVKPRALAKGLRPGDKIAFDVEGKTYVIVGLSVLAHAH
jgi:Cu/Ag efflux protein CusF